MGTTNALIDSPSSGLHTSFPLMFSPCTFFPGRCEPLGAHLTLHKSANLLLFILALSFTAPKLELLT